MNDNAAPFEDVRLALRCHYSVKDCKLIVCNGNISQRLSLIKEIANDPIPNATYLYRCCCCVLFPINNIVLVCHESVTLFSIILS